MSNNLQRQKHTILPLLTCVRQEAWVTARHAPPNLISGSSPREGFGPWEGMLCKVAIQASSLGFASSLRLKCLKELGTG